MARWFSIKPAVTFKGRSFLGVRGWSGKPAHPPLTDFPIVTYALAAVFDVISYFASRGSHAGAARDTAWLSFSPSPSSRATTAQLARETTCERI